MIVLEYFDGTIFELINANFDLKDLIKDEEELVKKLFNDIIS